MNHPVVYARVPTRVFDVLHHRAREQGISLSRVVRDILENECKSDVLPSDDISRFQVGLFEGPSTKYVDEGLVELSEEDFSSFDAAVAQADREVADYRNSKTWKTGKSWKTG